MALPIRVVRTPDPFMSLHREFDNMLGQMFGGGGQTFGGDLQNSFANYAVDVREDGEHLFVDAELPGFKKDEIDITLENQTLTISAQRKSEKTEGNGKDTPRQNANEDANKSQWLLQERRSVRFLRSFTLPPTVDEKRVDAKLNDGVLKITLYKKEEIKPRKIQVG